MTDVVPSWVGERSRHGCLLDQKPIDLVVALGSQCAEANLVWYLSTAIDGSPTVVTGVTLVPLERRGDELPIVAWGAGGSGLSVDSANSRSPRLSQQTDAYATFLGAILRAGYAVAATDYEGRSTKGAVRPLCSPLSAGRSMVDSVLALHDALPSADTAWYAVGHSSGGYAALEAAEVAESGYAERLDLRGVVALEPAADFSWILADLDVLLAPDSRHPVNRAVYLQLVASLTLEGLDLANYLGKDALARLQVVFEGDRQEIGTVFADLPTSEFGPRDEASARRLEELLVGAAVPRRRIGVPILFATGEGQADYEMIRRAHERSVSLGDDVTRLLYSGVDHHSLLERSVGDVVEWLDRLSGPGALEDRS